MAALDHDRVVDVDGDVRPAVSEGLVLLDFWAEWCGPCTALEPVLGELVEEYPDLTVARVDADGNEPAMEEFGVRSIPTLILFREGTPVEVFAGKVAYPKLARAVADHH
jgi:thioredoxin